MHNGKYNLRNFAGDYARIVDGRVEDCNCPDCKAARRKSIEEHILRDLPGRQKQEKVK